MDATAKYQWIAALTGILLALTKLTLGFAGAIPLFSSDIVLAIAVGLATWRVPRFARRWALLIGGPVVILVAGIVILVLVRRAQPGSAPQLGVVWIVSLATTPLACVLGSLTGSRLGTRRSGPTPAKS